MSEPGVITFSCKAVQQQIKTDRAKAGVTGALDFGCIDDDGRLVISPGADSIFWSYGLNTQSFPTYGGEVIQVLSSFIDNMQIEGHVRSYHELSSIYTWFLSYFKIVTQPGEFFQQAVTMEYPHRGWSFEIRPISLPAFHLGTEVVAPQYKIVAFVGGGGEGLKENLMHLVTLGVLNERFGVVNGEIGFTTNNPFSDPSKEGNAKFSSDYTHEFVSKSGTFFDNFVKGYMDASPSQHGDNVGSGPFFLNDKRQIQTAETTKPKKKTN